MLGEVECQAPGGDASCDTAFAPARRATRAEVELSIAQLKEHPLLQALLDAAGVCVLVLNEQRQILVGNAALLETLGAECMEQVEGLRPGEALGCIHAFRGPGGCGTSRECSTCGTVLAVLGARATGRTTEQECLMTVRRAERLEAFELRVRSSQVTIGGETYSVVGLRDVSAEKRRETLERVFLHDISNTLGALLLRSQSLAARAPAPTAEAARGITLLAERMKREIEDQRVLIQAENGTLEPKLAPMSPHAVLESAASVVRSHPIAQGRQLEVLNNGLGVSIVTDESLLVRVLVNMMKNALEATPRGGTVKAWAERSAEGCELRVWNAGVIPPTVALQIFKRSFSTKPGRGRGLGTFSMKLLGERYLGGSVGLRSTAAEGTTFFIQLAVAGDEPAR